jgi:hypothetical protein
MRGARGGGVERVGDRLGLSTAAFQGVALAWWEEEDEGQLYAAASTGDASGLREFAILCIRSGQALKPDRPRAESDELPAPERHDEGDRAPGPASPGQLGWTVGERASTALTKTGSPFHRGGRQFWRRSEECFSNLTRVRPAKA